MALCDDRQEGFADQDVLIRAHRQRHGPRCVVPNVGDLMTRARDCVQRCEEARCDRAVADGRPLRRQVRIRAHQARMRRPNSGSGGGQDQPVRRQIQRPASVRSPMSRSPPLETRLTGPPPRLVAPPLARHRYSPQRTG